MFKRFSFVAVAATLAMFVGSEVFAQRTGIWKPHYGRSGGGGGARSAPSGPSFNYARPVQPAYSQPAYAYTPSQPMIAADPGYRSFSFEPVGINPNDTVVVHRNNAHLMLGKNVVSALPHGTTFQVTKIVNGWLGAIVNVNGQEQKGWIWNGNVRLADHAVPTPPAG